MSASVAVLRTRPETVVADYGRLMRLVKYDQVLPRDQELIVKLNLSWTKYFPACSSQPWQLDGVLNTLVEDGYERARVHPVENKTVVTNPVEGCRNNKWEPVLRRQGFRFTPLTDVEWIRYPFKSPLLKLNRIFPEGIEIPKMYVGRNVLHLPTVKCVHPDTEIMLADGAVVRAEALVKTWQVREGSIDLPDGDRVSEGQVRVVAVAPDGRLNPGYATHFWRTPLTRESLWAVRTRTGRSVVTSRVHPFLTPEGWVPAHALRPGDRIAIARRVRLIGVSQPLPGVRELGHDAVDVDALPIRAGRKYSIEVQRDIIRAYIAGDPITTIAKRLSTHWETIRGIIHRYGIASRWRRVWARAPYETTTSFWRWMGYFTAEGYAYDCNGSYRVSFANTDPEVRRDYIELSETLFGVKTKSRGIEIYFDAFNLRVFFESLGFTVPTSSGTKTVPDVLFKCPDVEIAAFVQGYLDGDGTVEKVGVSATTKSRRLASQIQMLLSRLGIVAFLGTTWARATNGRSTEKQEYAKLSIYGDDVVTLATWMTFRCAHKQRRLDMLRRRREAGVRPSNWDTIPIAPALFRMVREGLGLTHATSMRPSSVNSIENGYTEPIRPIVPHFIELFSRLDTAGRFADEIAYMRFLASDDLAWDRVDDVRTESAEVPFLYDLSVEGAQSFVGNGIILHNTHGHSITTGAIKNAFGGLLKEVRHYAHEFIHEVMVDLMYMQRELHPGVFAVMDGTVMGDGAGPRTMVPRVGNLILASQDQVAIDAIAAKIIGFDPLSIPYLAMCHERGLGIADPRDIEIVGDAEAAHVNMGFKTSRSLVIWGDQLIRRGPLRPLKRLLLHSPLMVWAPFASNVYHDLLWYPTVGRARIRAFAATPWGRLFGTY